MTVHKRGRDSERDRERWGRRKRERKRERDRGRERERWRNKAHLPDVLPLPLQNHLLVALHMTTADGSWIPQ